MNTWHLNTIIMKNNEPNSIIPETRIENVIYLIRGRKILLDQDLAALYGVETKQLNRSIKRNHERFPEDFIFQLTKDEWGNLKCQIGTSSLNWGGRRKLPIAFTEHGVLMAANLLKSERAIEVSVEIVRTFIRLREFLGLQKEFAKELAEIKGYVLKNTHKTNREFMRIWRTIEKLTEKPKEQRLIGFDLN